jgi:cytochrome P450
VWAGTLESAVISNNENISDEELRDHAINFMYALLSCVFLLLSHPTVQKLFRSLPSFSMNVHNPTLGSLAGRDTTAATLTFLFYLLAQNPQAEQKARPLSLLS